MTAPVVETIGLTVTFNVSGSLFKQSGGRILQAENDVSLSFGAGEVMGLVAESGSGKTTTGRAILCLLRPSGGSVHFDRVDITYLERSAMRPLPNADDFPGPLIPALFHG